MFTGGHLFRKSGVIASCRVIGVLTGFALDAAVVAFFGFGGKTDAFFAAVAIPFLIDATINTQFSQVLIPMLATLQKEKGSNASNAYLSNVISVWVVAVSALAAIAMALSPFVVPSLVPGMNSDSIQVAVRLTAILVWLVPISGLAAFLSAALYSRHKYWLSSSTKAINNISIILVALATFRGLDIYSLAVGYLAGASVQCVVLFFALQSDGFRFCLRFDPRDSELKETATLVFYPLAGQMLGEVRTLLENFCASFYAPGVLSALRYASRITYALSGIVMGSIVTAATPVVAHHMADRNLEAMKESMKSAVKLLLCAALPICLFLIYDGDRLIRLMFLRGRFQESDVKITSELLALMCPYVFFSRFVSLSQTPFYAVKNTKTLMVSMVWSFVLYVAIIPGLLKFFKVHGFPVATSLSSILSAAVMCSLLKSAFGPMGWSSLGGFVGRLAGAAVVGSLGFILGKQIVLGLPFQGISRYGIEMAIPGALGSLFLLAGVFAFRVFKVEKLLAPARTIFRTISVLAFK